jgi:uncharacterized protein (DUF362 family)
MSQSPGLEFKERMSGWIGIGEQDFVEGRVAGQLENTAILFDCHIIIEDLDKFFRLTEHRARLEGTVTFNPLGGPFAIEDGIFNLFSVDQGTGDRLMVYSFRFTAGDGNPYFLYGEKRIKNDPGFDLLEDMTTLFTTVYAGPDKNAPIYGAGQVYFQMKNLPSMMASMKVTGTKWWELLQKIGTRVAFMDFAWGKVREEYFRRISPFYDTEYENLVLSGKVKHNGATKDFFLVSGIHDKEFPWGDGEIFWDVLLVIGNDADGYQRYCITDRILPGLELNVKEGTYRYRGPIYELTEGYATRFSHIRDKKAYLRQYQADFSINFNAQPYAITPFPFVTGRKFPARLATGLKWMMHSILPGEHLLGVFITPHTVRVYSGTLNINNGGTTSEYTLVPERTFGEGERTTIKNIKEPTMLYGYICAVRPEAQTARVQIHCNSLRNERQRLIKDQFDAALGAAFSKVASKEILMEGGQVAVRALGPQDGSSGTGAPRFIKLQEPVLEINNDHFPTAVFQRRIITVKDPSGETCLALEEDMDLMRLEAENSDREVTVASIRDSEGKGINALDAVLDATNFFDLIEKTRQAKPKSEFSIVIKPNFMFAYNKSDRTTFTDPELVEHLVKVLRDRGFENITVVEAQSTYGEFFDNRGVLEVAEYLGYKVDCSAGYKLVDLTEDQCGEELCGAHLGCHRVPLTWRDADFRISFAKNKTHAYAYYTLTLKNIYGALPLADKFSEYHTGRDIYHTTMEYLRCFPVHFGLIDAYLSADGPFGIFADPEPNETHTIIGGADLVAVDWVGATKMGLDPKISKYMRLAVKAFGKPEIALIGDRTIYRPWLNVPTALTFFTNYGLDANNYIGKLLYRTGAYMDENQFHHNSKSAVMKTVRKVISPLQKAIFLQAEGKRTRANELVSKYFTWLGSQ